MGSFEIVYEADEDVLEVTFDSVDERLARSMPITNEIMIHTDAMLSRVWGITIYSYSQLLQVTDFQLEELLTLDEPARAKMLSLLLAPEVACFIEVLDTEELRVIIKAPRLAQLISNQ